MAGKAEKTKKTDLAESRLRELEEKLRNPIWVSALLYKLLLERGPV